MGKVLSLITKPIREFNIESRAHSLIGKDKPKPAPKHKSDLSNYEHMLKEHPEYLEESAKKHDTLDKYLKDVYIVSHDAEVAHEPQLSTNPERPLPLDRTLVEDFEYGFYEPSRVPIGRVTLRKALRFISEYNVDSKTYNSYRIAEEHILPEDTVRDVLKYFKVYEIYIPQQRKVKATFAGPIVPRVRLNVEKQKQIGGAKSGRTDDSSK